MQELKDHAEKMSEENQRETSQLLSKTEIASIISFHYTFYSESQ